MESVRSVDRAASLIEIIGTHNGRGLRLVDVVSKSGLQKTTVARLLATLVNLGLVEVDPVTDRYHLGFSLVSLGMLASTRFGLIQLAQPGLIRIADETRDTVHLSVRAGNESVCIDVIRGSWPIRTLTLGVGDRRPLGAGSGSLAILAGLPDNEVDAIIAANAHAYEAWEDLSARRVRELVDETRRQGYAFIDEVLLSGVRGVAAPILTADGAPLASISVSAVTNRLDVNRRLEVSSFLSAEAQSLTGELARVTGALPVDSTTRWLLKSSTANPDRVTDM